MEVVRSDLQPPAALLHSSKRVSPGEIVDVFAVVVVNVAGKTGPLGGRDHDRAGGSGDRVRAESFWSTFKNEYYHRHTFATTDAARRGAYTWIDGWYNAQRRHASIGYLSPLEYERRQRTLAA